ncbi:hypothetical protein PHJA_001599700 [Phtheirospermum japonicum]|uniref:Uncharacterized protein n=1 Tax=Phtheirospermum japonicum TaxID=374723 RepID=A0A830CEX5_9LAMI|nr:hypothetical protein PHJA_001599700 [Phtheirospermum japonicum]
MKSAGQLSFLKNNYLKPDPNARPAEVAAALPSPKLICRRVLLCRLPVPAVDPPNPLTRQILSRRPSPSPQAQLLQFPGENVVGRPRLLRLIWVFLCLPPPQVRHVGVVC